MATLIPSQQSQQQQQQQQQSATSVEAYEDMFKEITRKLYGDESAHGLYPHNTQIAQQRMEPELLKEQMEGGERSFTTLVSDRNLALEYDGVISDTNNFKSEDHLTTAFGLAALMQNGFPATSILNPVSFPVATTKQQNANLTTQNQQNEENRWVTTQQQQQQQSNQQQTQQQQQSHNQQQQQNSHHIQQSAQQSQQQSHHSNNANNSGNNVTNSNNNQQSTNQQSQQSVVDEIMPWNSNKLTNSYISATQKLFKVKTKQEPMSTAEIIVNSIPTSVTNVSNANSIANANTQTTNVTIIAPTVIKSEINPIGQIQKRYNCSSCPYSTDRRDLFTRHENIHKDEKPFHCFACLKQFNRADHVKKHFLRMHREMTYDINKTRRFPTNKNNNNNNNNNSITTQNNQNSSNNNNSLSVNAGITSNNFFTQQIQQPNQQQQQQTQNNNAVQHTTTITIPTTFSQQQHHAQSTTNNQAHTIDQVVQNAVNQQNLVISSNQQATQQALQQQTQQAQQQQQQQAQQQQPTQVQTITNIITNIKHEKTGNEKPLKKKGEKRFMCCYCPWSGADNWGLKRHLNTHTKPFVCLLCDYKAARSERLATHVFKVHNKKACNKCSFFADDQTQLVAHQLEAHQNESRNRTSNPTNITHSNALASVTNSIVNIASNTNNNNANNNNTNNNPSTNNNNNMSSNVTSGGSNNNTGNVLRTLTNTFVPNTPTLSNIHTSTSHVFGSLNSSLNNAATTIFTTNSNTNLVEQLNQHLASNNWRTSSNTTTTNQTNNTNSTNNNASTTNNNSNNISTNNSSNLNTTMNSISISNANNISNLHNINLINAISRTPTSIITTSITPVSTKRKTGAERLFQYMEADDSDPELDYARQLQMQALSRNTASVAQDFHNAGGVANKKNNIVVNVNNNNNTNTINNNISNRICDTTTSISIGNSTTPTTMVNNSSNNSTKKAMSDSPIESPPATSFDMKRRRKSSSSNDKENENELLKRQIEFLKQQHQLFLNALCLNNINVVDKIKAEKEINEIFDKLYKNSISLYASYQSGSSTSENHLQPTVEQSPKRKCIEPTEFKANGNGNTVNIEALPEFLRNNKEITIIVEPKNVQHQQSHHQNHKKLDEIVVEINKKHNRKQSMPRKIEKPVNENGQEQLDLEVTMRSTNLINKLRDKHMINLITKKKHCVLCKSTNYRNCYYTKTSLMLHKMWRHQLTSRNRMKCEHCDMHFEMPYKFALHRKTQKH